jgi:hypothetical protein
MTLQTVELHGERYVIVRESDFLELQQKAQAATSIEPKPLTGAGFRHVVPLRVGGDPASELLIRDRR